MKKYKLYILVLMMSFIICVSCKKNEEQTLKYQPYVRKHNSIGYLVRDMIDIYASNTNVSLKSLKKLLSSKIWFSPWVDEVITDEVPKRPDHFYMKDEEKVKLSDSLIYVARYWTTNDALEMAKLLGLEIKVLG